MRINCSISIEQQHKDKESKGKDMRNVSKMHSYKRMQYTNPQRVLTRGG